MRAPTRLIFILLLGVSIPSQGALGQTQDFSSVLYGEAALTFASGAIQKFTPRDGTVNLVTGDNQTTGNRMLLGRHDTFYLKLDKPHEVAVGDLFTVYRRVRKVFHPATGEYLGFVIIRLGVVKATQIDHSLITVEAVTSYGMIAPGDLVMRFAVPAPGGEINQVADVAEISGMIVELQADRTMTLVSQSDVVYVDRGREDGLKTGDLMDVYRHGSGLPPRKIGQLRVLSTEDRTATAKIIRANTRIMRGDRYKLVGYTAPVMHPVELPSAPEPSQADMPKMEQAVAAPVPADQLVSRLKVQDASGESRINLGELTNFLRYDSGEASIKPESYKILDQLIDYLHTSGDSRLIRVEGHADNVEIGPSLKSRYPSNWELSRARASGVVRYLVEKGGVDSARIKTVGYGDSKPIATNAIEEGRTKNRRVEILLYAPHTDPEASKLELPGQAQKPEDDPSSLSARGEDNKPAVSGDDLKGTEPGSLSPVDPPQVPTKDGANPSNVPDTGGSLIPDTGIQNIPQPAGPPLQ